MVRGVSKKRLNCFDTRVISSEVTLLSYVTQRGHAVALFFHGTNPVAAVLQREVLSKSAKQEKL